MVAPLWQEAVGVFVPPVSDLRPPSLIQLQTLKRLSVARSKKGDCFN